MAEDWLDRWQNGRTGWHEPAGNDGLKEFWPDTATPGRVLVPLCGKAPDLLWLAQRGHDVVGVELSEIAVEGFFDDHDLQFARESSGSLDRFSAKKHSITLYCGDYFNFQSQPYLLIAC